MGGRATFAKDVLTSYYLLTGGAVPFGSTEGNKTMTVRKNKAARKVTARIASLISSAAGIGFNAAGGFAAGVKLAQSIGKDDKALKDAGREYQIGYACRYLSEEPLFAKRWGNLSDEQRMAEARLIADKASPDSMKGDRRTDLEHKAFRAAAVSWSACKTKAGVVVKQARKPRPGKNKAPAKTIAVDLVKASPALKTKGAANDYFANAAAALLATVNKNAKLLEPRISTAVSDFKAAIEAALKPAE